MCRSGFYMQISICTAITIDIYVCVHTRVYVCFYLTNWTVKSQN